MKKTKALTLLLFVTCFLAAGAIWGEELRSILSTGAPGMNRFPAAPPGKTEVLPRPYDGGPPFVPHNVAAFKIDGKGNACVGCHGQGVAVGKSRAAKIPPSHYVNEATGAKSEKSVTPMRYHCLQCHVPQSIEEPPY